MRSGLRVARSDVPVVFMSNFTVMRSPALVFRPVNPASKTFSQSVPKTNLFERYSCSDVEVVQRRRLNAEALAKLIVSLVV